MASGAERRVAVFVGNPDANPLKSCQQRHQSLADMCDTVPPDSSYK
jgi:hypothetical protein